MIRRNFQDKQLPLLGMGMMRLPIKNNDLSDIDEVQTEKMIEHAMKKGANYFDTAWGYHGGNSELVAGNILKKYPRDSFYLATKFPGYDLSNMDKVEEIFEEQLKKCQVDYFDFYLMHNICELNIDAYLDESYGIMAYLLEQKKNGRIRHLGCSVHGNYETLERFLAAYGKHMEFCQLQVNWLDWEFQGAKKKAALIEEYGLPLWVMEPLRGGKLASFEEGEERSLKELRPHESAVGWAFSFLQTIPSVTVILGGMSSLEQMQENCALFETDTPLTAPEQSALAKIAENMLSKTSLPCTECGYCIDYCPQELNIPFLISLYNQRRYTGEGDFISLMALGSLTEDKKPHACTACKSCEAVCPQQLKISDAMSDFAQMFSKG